MKKIGIFISAAMIAFVSIFAATAASGLYAVVPGDTVWQIAARYETSIKELLQANPQIQNQDLIYVGDSIFIPVAGPLASFEAEVVRLVNVERVRNGLQQLQADTALARVARIKAQEMIDLDYFSHSSPTYGSPFSMMEQFGLQFSSAGENLAFGQTTAQEVVQDWMNSPGHRANILSPSYTNLGVGAAKKANGTLYWAQLFSKPY